VFSNSNKQILLVVLLIIILGALPLAIYWYSFGRFKTVSVQDAVALLSQPDVVLIDVRSAKDYSAKHINGAKNWDFSSIQSITLTQEIPDEFKHKTLLLICDSGITSAWAVDALERIGVANVYNVLGGMQTWIASEANLGNSRYAKMQLASGEIVPLTLRTSTLDEQLAVFVAGYFIKPLYMLLALGLVIVLWREQATDMRALAWSLISFLIGETACWINFIFLNEQSHWLEYVHSFGMVVCIGFLTFALIQTLDHRIIGLSDPKQKCAFLGLCHGCVKFKPVPCGLRRLFMIGIPALIVLAVMPLNAATYAVSYNTRVFGFFHNYSHSVFYQLYETRFSPFAAIALLLTSFALMLLNRNNLLPAKIFFAGGMGFLGFSFLRLMFFQFYRDNLVWFAFWEEATELILIAAIACVILIFRKALLPQLVQVFGVRV
jgi:thiosulfate sulfurtransferase